MPMKKMMSVIETHAFVPMEKISQQKYLLAIREGIMAAFPLTLIASIFLFFTVIPLPASWGIKQFLVAHEQVILAPYRMTVFISTLYIVIGVGSSLARNYRYDPLSGGLIAIIAFLMTILPIQPSALIPQDFLYQAKGAGLDTAWVAAVEDLGWVLPEAPLAESGILVGVLAAVFGVEVMHLCKKIRFAKRKDPEYKSLIPPSVARTMETILPISIVIFTLFILRDILQLDLQGGVTRLMQQILQMATTFPGALTLVFLATSLWTLGIRGFTVASTTAAPVWMQMIQENTAAHAAGQAIPNIAPLPFYQWFVWLGGTGATLSLVILLCFSKAKYLRRLGLTSLLPSLVNINEPLLYGVPLILNPFMAIPFVLGPTLCTLVAYGAMHFHLVTPPHTAPASAFPAPVGAYLSTGDWRAVILCLFNLVLCATVYYPFLKAYENKIQAEGEAAAAKRALEKTKPPTITYLE